jgi:hypothetical protein
MAKTSEAEVKKSFFALVNLTPRELEAWLETEESKSVGFDSGDGESVGHKSGRRIVAILRKKRVADADDIVHMRKVVGFIRRHLAQPPGRDVETSRWRYSLMNWGHDPMKISDADAPWR